MSVYRQKRCHSAAKLSEKLPLTIRKGREAGSAAHERFKIVVTVTQFGRLPLPGSTICGQPLRLVGRLRRPPRFINGVFARARCRHQGGQSHSRSAARAAAAIVIGHSSGSGSYDGCTSVTTKHRAVVFRPVGFRTTNGATASRQPSIGAAAGRHMSSCHLRLADTEIIARRTFGGL